MDPRERADAALARARARSAYVVTPDDAISPMDAASTLQIPRAMVTAADADHDQPDSTMVISNDVITSGGHPAGTARGEVPHPHQYPPPVYPQTPQPYPEPPYPEPEEQPAPRQLDGLVPTVQQPGQQRSLLSRRLDGN
ncbi:MAG TPA: hypothetical protein VH352_17630 [Pseudonocardiaceae bacterium]|jgi:hypothetical protein|nr:hypothetical protein [Pseudonocardiaceae bacterium]